MPYQLRTFQPILKQEHIPSEIIDLYLYKNNQKTIGIKLRDPEVKKYGYKIKYIEVKVLENNEENMKAQKIYGFQMEKWKKYTIKCKDHFKIFTKKYIKAVALGEQKPKKQEQIIPQTLEQHLQGLNKIICLNLGEEFKLNDLKKEERSGEKQIVEGWIRNENKLLQIFEMKKNKEKYEGVQIGKLEVKGLFSEMKGEKVSQYKTICYESHSMESLVKIIEQKITQNMSYPTFIQYLYQNALK